jgi:hypothetical protein
MKKTILILLLFFCSINVYSQNRFFVFEKNEKKGLVDEIEIIKVIAEHHNITDLKRDDWTNIAVFLIEKNIKFWSNGLFWKLDLSIIIRCYFLSKQQFSKK